MIEQIGNWALRWARDQLTEKDYDLELLMLDLQRSIQTDKLVGGETVIRFNFSDVQAFPSWWLVVEDEDVDVCMQDPGKEVDVYFNCCLKVMCQLWMGDLSYRRAIAEGKPQMVGIPALTKQLETWLAPSRFAGIAPARQIIESV